MLKKFFLSTIFVGLLGSTSNTNTVSPLLLCHACTAVASAVVSSNFSCGQRLAVVLPTVTFGLFGKLTAALLFSLAGLGKLPLEEISKRRKRGMPRCWKSETECLVEDVFDSTIGLGSLFWMSSLGLVHFFVNGVSNGSLAVGIGVGGAGLAKKFLK